MFRNIYLNTFVSVASLFVTFYSRAEIDVETKTFEKEVLNTAHSTLEYVLKAQSVGDGQVFKGEWANYIYFNKIKIPGRSETKYLDSNSFVTSSIYDLLAEIYEKNPSEHQKILPHLDLAIDSLKNYQSHHSFNFWPLLPKKINLESYADFKELNLENYKSKKLGHRPSYFPLKNRLEINFTNIVNDADDTALAYRAIYRHKKYERNVDLLESGGLEQNIEALFDNYRDVSRKTNHFYNSFVGNVRSTGAYLTWFGKEANLFNFSTKVLPMNKKSSIPFGVNDVDCVVNANILNTLAITERLEQSSGKEAACSLIKRAFDKKKSKVCGLYYPSEYTLHFTSSNAIKNGVSCLQDVREDIAKEILNDQKINGSFVSKWHNSESIQSTAYAMASLLNILDENNKEELSPAIKKGINYLLSQAKFDSSGNMYYEGGAFFSGGTVIRKKLLWVSDAYTTALVSNVLFKYLESFPKNESDQK